MEEEDIRVADTVRVRGLPSPRMRVIATEPDGRFRCFWFNRRNEPQAMVFRGRDLMWVPAYQPPPPHLAPEPQPEEAPAAELVDTE